MADAPDDAHSELVDLSSVPLSDLISATDTVLDNALRRVLDDAERNREAISGWTSYVDKSGGVHG